MRTPTTIAFVWCVASALGCPGAPQPVFPKDYASTYQEVRDCRRSGDHDLNYIRVLADPLAYEPYRARTAFPAGAVVMKAEFADSACSDLAGFTAMQKQDAGTAPEAGDWSWQRVTKDHQVMVEENVARCVGCHQPCQAALGHDWTCAEP